MRKLAGQGSLFRGLFGGVFIAFVVGVSILLLYMYRRAAPPKYFYSFIACVGAFVLAEVLVYTLVRRRFADRPMVTKCVDLFTLIAFSLLLYLFGVYVYPAR